MAIFTRFNLIMLSLVLALTSARASSPEVQSTFLSTFNGLPNNTVRNIFQDSRGYLWFCTSNGLGRYDGYRFENFRQDMDDEVTFADPHVASGFESSDGLIWLWCGSDFVSCFDPVKNTLVDFTGKGLYKRHFKKLGELGGNVWLWGAQGAMRIDYADGTFNSTCFTSEDGKLPSNNVGLMAADHRGRVWICLSNAIYEVVGDNIVKRLDGVTAKRFITIGDNKTLIVGTNGKVYHIAGDSEKPKFVAQLPMSESDGDVVGCFYADGSLHAYTNAASYALDPASGEVKHLNGDLDLPGAQVIEDASGDKWIHNRSGKLVYYNVADGKVAQLDIMPRELAQIVDLERIHVALDHDNHAWISVKGNGLFDYDKTSGKLTHYGNDGGSGAVIPTDLLLCVTVDRDGVVWVGGEFIGAAKIERAQDGNMLRLAAMAELPGQDRTVRLIKRIGDRILIGQRNGSLYEYDSRLDKLLGQADYKSVVYDVCQDSHGHRWLGTRGSGVYVDGVNYRNDRNNPASLSSDQIFALNEDRQGRMWIATFGGGLSIATPGTDGQGFKFRSFFNNDFSRRFARCVVADKRGNLWAGTNEGLFVFKPDELLSDTARYQVYNFLKGNFRDDIVHAVTEDSQGRMWIATDRSGIAIVDNPGDIADLKFRYIDAAKGLVNSTVMSITPLGRGGDMMVATEYGLSRVNAEGEVVENYLLASEPEGNVYSCNSAVALGDSIFLVGSIKGLHSLNAYKGLTSQAPRVSFTGLMANGQRLNLGKAYDADKDCIRLETGTGYFEIDFSTLEYSAEHLPRYSYWLEGYDKGWSEPSSLNQASYKGLEPGTYTLHVRAARKDGRWGEEATVKVHIPTPWYASWWAKLLYALLIIGLVALIIRFIAKIEHLRNKVKVEERLTDYKLEFFTNISHEFRTPLTLIQVSLEKIRGELASGDDRVAKRSLAEPVATLDKNSRRMSRLINELLTFRKVEKNKLTLAPEPTEVIGFVRDIFNSFQDEARLKQLHFTMESPLKDKTINIDRPSLDKIVHNLISNAIKYTGRGGKVEVLVTANESTGMFQIQVRDNGIGIDADRKPMLFSQFMQTNFTRNSIGVGLHLTHGLVQLYGGSIRHEDNVGGGSVFTVEIPMGLQAVERPTTDLDPLPDTAPEYQSPTIESQSIPVAELKAPETDMKLLIIDDDADIREVLNKEFSQYFEVLLAVDGAEGLKMARENDIALAICDVMLPDMSGYEVTRRLKDDVATSHIPIIQLTALSNDESHIKSIEMGADAYVTKPFSLHFLKARAFKLIELRKTLIAKFSTNPAMSISELPMLSRDREFSEKLQEVLNRHLDNNDFSVDDFAAAMNLGRTIFFKKVKGITGYPPKEYIRIMRMKKAAELLLTTDLTISEVTYRVGMTDPAYFNKCFKSQFGKAPSAYQKENRQAQPK